MKRSALFALLTALLFLSACTLGDDTSAENEPATTTQDADATSVAEIKDLPAQESLLFALQAESGDLQEADGDGYALTLDHAARQTTWFSDRPARDGGTISTQAFVLGWADLGFTDVPPNAVLTVAGQDEPLIVELGEPTYDHDERTLRVAVTVVGPKDRKVAAGPFGASSLFIDNATLDAGCGYIGEIDFFPTNITPAGYVPADGRTVSSRMWPDLYELTGTRFGGDANRFAMPTVEGPGAGLHALVCGVGLDPSETDPDDDQIARSCLIGQLQLFAFETPAYGYALADGKLLNPAKRSALYGLMGDVFGGDGETTFALPDIASLAGTSQQVCTSTTNKWSDNSSTGACYMSQVGFWATPRSNPPSNWWRTQTSGSASGVLISVKQHQPLFDLFGTAFGGDGRNVFALPKLDLPERNLVPTMCVYGYSPPRD
ncbi:phage tail protein [Nocardioides gilvus]|uniref:phage tail protein n=1 Tax=Nocardioides gilvus TaxID=1735589 RepID=UPI000D7423D7|nr:phage tail protein [Nocardioides gilvus]